MKAPFKHFDIPRQHLPDNVTAYVPPRARSAEEIERRRERPIGALMAEYQWRGLMITADALRNTDSNEDFGYFANTAAYSGLNSDFHGTAEHSEVMRRRRHLPQLVHADPAVYFYNRSLNIRHEVRTGFNAATIAAYGLMTAIEQGKPGLEGRRLALGRMIGNASLAAACFDIQDRLASATPYIGQVMARDQGLQALRQARSIGAELGTAPSLAQLADPDSDLSVHIRRTAPDGAYRAFEAAVEKYKMPI